MNRLSDGRNLSLSSETSCTNEFHSENRTCQTAVKKSKPTIKFPPLRFDFEQELKKIKDDEEEKSLSTSQIDSSDEIDGLEEFDNNDSTPTNSIEATPSQKLIMQTPMKHKVLQTVAEVDDETPAKFNEDVVKSYKKYPNCTPGLLVNNSESHSHKRLTFETPFGCRTSHDKFHTPANFINKVPPKITLTTPGSLLRQSIKFENNSLQKSAYQDGSKPKIQCSVDVSSYMKPQVNKMLFSSARKPLRTQTETGNENIMPRLQGGNENIVPRILRSPKFEDVFKTITVNNVTYAVLNEIGRGGSSVVYHCFDPKSKTDCAIKCVNVDRDQTIVNSFINEVKTLLRLQKCDRIVKMYGYEFQEEEKRLFVVLEKGSKDLAFILKELSAMKKLPMYLLIYYWMEMLYAVKQIHMNGVIHSDLKPANFLEANGRIKLIDFGIASCVQSDQTSVIKSDTIGTLDYISPEAIYNEKSTNCDSPNYGKTRHKINCKSDVWSLGCILYKMIYRKTPFQHLGNTLAKMTMIVDPNQKIEFPHIDWVPPMIKETLQDCLQYNVKSRPSVEDLIKQYENMYY